MGKTSLVEKIEFFWYVRRISFLALIGYIGGAAAYVLLHYISSSRDPKLIQYSPDSGTSLAIL